MRLSETWQPSCSPEKLFGNYGGYGELHPVASAVAKYRKAVLKQNKNNKKDAEATARYAMALEAQGKLDGLKRVWMADEELRGLTRMHEQKTKDATRELNRLWKLIRTASVDLYLALGGRHPDIDIGENILKNMQIMELLVIKSDI